MTKNGSKGKRSLLKWTSPHRGALFAFQKWAALSRLLQRAALFFCAGTNSVTLTLFSRRKLREVYGRASVNLDLHDVLR